MKRKSRYARTSRLLVLLLCALLLAGMLPSFGALSATKNSTGSLTVKLKTDIKKLPKDAKIEYTLYKVATAAPATTAGWTFEDGLTRVGKDIIEAKNDTALQNAVNALAGAITQNDATAKKYFAAKKSFSSLDGKAVFAGLDLGVYLGVLTAAPNGLTANPSLYTIPSWNADKTKLLYDLDVNVKDTYLVTEDKRKDDAVTVTKTDGNSQISGATFKLYDEDGKTELKTYTGGQFEIKTADLPQNVLPVTGEKTLILKETGVPTGYKGDSTAYPVVISVSKKPEYNEDHTKLITTTAYSIRINKQKSIDISNPPITDVATDHNEVTITKTDGSAQISGATFTLYYGTTTIKEYTGGQFRISTADLPQSVLPAVGGARELTLKETSAPAGYTGSDAEYKVVISASESTAWNDDHEKLVTTTTYNITIDDGKNSLTVPNTPITGVSRQDGKVTVTKTDGSTPIDGATFTLYDGDKAIKTYTGKQFEISTADEKLQSILPEADKVKTLTLKETTAPKGYTGSNTEYKVEIAASESTAWNDDHTMEITTTAYTISIDGKDALTVPNTPITGVEDKYGAITVYKVDGSQQALAGAEFTLYSGETAIKTYGGGNVSTIVISTKDAELSKYLPAVGESAKLTLKETKAPAGYTASSQTYEVVLSTSASQGWNRDHTRYVTTTTYDITIADGKNSVTVVNTVTPTTSPSTPPDDDVPPPAPPAPTPEPTVEISGTKVWVDESNIHKVRPGSITITLLADGSPVNASPSWSKGGDNWTYTFRGLPEYSSSGGKITYTVQETPVDRYESSVSGLTITNKLIPSEPEKYTEISGQKTWNDSNNANGKRPTNITVRLYRDGVEIESRTVTAGTDWKYTFGSLPVDDGYGNIYTYEVREDGVKGYFTRVEDMNVTNSVIDGSTPPPSTTEDGTPPPEGITPNVPQKPEDVPERKTGTPVPRFEEKTDEELEELFDMFGYGTPLYGMLGTGDQVPVWVWICAGAGVLALIAFIATGRKKKKAK